MEKPIIYRLSDPNYTIYHRAALGGLAATIRAWTDNPPLGVRGSIDEPEKNSISLNWDDCLTDEEVFTRILAHSFLLDNKTSLIKIPGMFLSENRPDLGLAVHNGILNTFYAHRATSVINDGPRKTEIIRDADGNEIEIPFQPIKDCFFHQISAPPKTRNRETIKFKKDGSSKEKGILIQKLLPGTDIGRKAIEARVEEVLLMHFLLVACPIFNIKSRIFNQSKQRRKIQSCLIIPDVIDLQRFAAALSKLYSVKVARFSNTYLGRQVAGAEEAALSFMLDLSADDLLAQGRKSINGCLAIAMGVVSWGDPKQKYRSSAFSLKDVFEYSEISVFERANQLFGGGKIKKGESENYIESSHPIPELIAANLAANRHWCDRFLLLVDSKKKFRQMRFSTGGLSKVSKVVKDDDDKVVIKTFQQAWKMTMGQIGERSEIGNLDFERLVEVRREKIRNEILRAKTPSALAGWFLKFCADATKGASLAPIRDDADRIRFFIFNPRNFDRFQNLLLFALLSYVGDHESNT